MFRKIINFLIFITLVFFTIVIGINYKRYILDVNKDKLLSLLNKQVDFKQHTTEVTGQLHLSDVTYSILGEIENTETINKYSYLLENNSEKLKLEFYTYNNNMYIDKDSIKCLQQIFPSFKYKSLYEFNENYYTCSQNINIYKILKDCIYNTSKKLEYKYADTFHFFALIPQYNLHLNNEEFKYVWNSKKIELLIRNKSDFICSILDMLDYTKNFDYVINYTDEACLESVQHFKVTNKYFILDLNLNTKMTPSLVINCPIIHQIMDETNKDNSTDTVIISKPEQLIKTFDSLKYIRDFTYILDENDIGFIKEYPYIGTYNFIISFNPNNSDLITLVDTSIHIPIKYLSETNKAQKNTFDDVYAKITNLNFDLFFYINSDLTYIKKHPNESLEKYYSADIKDNHIAISLKYIPKKEEVFICIYNNYPHL